MMVAIGHRRLAILQVLALDDLFLRLELSTAFGIAATTEIDVNNTVYYLLDHLVAMPKRRRMVMSVGIYLLTIVLISAIAFET